MTEIVLVAVVAVAAAGLFLLTAFSLRYMGTVQARIYTIFAVFEFILCVASTVRLARCVRIYMAPDHRLERLDEDRRKAEIRYQGYKEKMEDVK